MMVNNYHTFSFGDCRLAELGAVIRQRPTHVVAVPDIVFVTTPYHSGDSLLNNGRFNNISLKIPIRTLPALCDKTLQEFEYSLTEWLLSDAGNYKKYRDTYNPSYYRIGAVESIDDVVAVKKNVYETTVTINCKPFMYSDFGEIPIIRSTSGNTIELSLVNPERWDSSPNIKIIGGAGSYTFDVNDITFSATMDSSGEFTIDKENENVYDENHVSINNKTTGIEIPYFRGGTNEISIIRSNGTGAWTVEITPKWRRL